MMAQFLHLIGSLV